MSWKRVVPSSVHELHQKLVQMFENKKHINSVKVDSAARVIRVDLSFAANSFGNTPDFEIPIRGDMVTEVKEIIARMMREFESGSPPTFSAAEKLYQFMDHSAGN